MIEFDTTELRKWGNDLGAAGPMAARAASRRLTEVAGRLRDDARRNAPVDSGALRDSIKVAGGRNFRTVYTDVRYGAFVEYGTADTAPQPYFEPAIRPAYARLADALEDVGEESIT